MSRRRFLALVGEGVGVGAFAPLARRAGGPFPQTPRRMGLSGRPMWIGGGAPQPDSYVAFRGRFDLPADQAVEIRSLGASWYVIWLDGQPLDEGPARFILDHGEYQRGGRRLGAGHHVLAIQAHHVGVGTRLLEAMAPFVSCQVDAGGEPVPVVWTCRQLTGYQRQVRRVNPQLGWIEWCDTRSDPEAWQGPAFDDAGWDDPVFVESPAGDASPPTIGPVRRFTHELRPMAEGRLVETFGYERDDVPARFLLRALEARTLPAQGRWRRYDLGRVRLGRVRFVLDVPAGAVVECAYSEALSHGRVAPYITLSAGPSCNLDHYVARGGVQEFGAFTPKGGRFVEVHVLAAPDRIRFLEEAFIERGYHGAPEGAFTCGEALLDRIWATGLETYRACAEDAVVDTPTRERGQWTGDVVSVGLDLAGVGYSDLRLIRRALVQSALCAREDGLVAALSPGERRYLTTYAAQWIAGCLHFHELTGDMSLLEDLYPHAVRNLGAFEAHVGSDGLADSLGWAFVDWGYARPSGPVDMAVNLHYLAGLRAMLRWCDLLNRPEHRPTYERREAHIHAAVRDWLGRTLAGSSGEWGRVGYHVAVLALALGVVEASREDGCVSYLKQHVMSCFPNDPDGPRLSDPGVAGTRLMTPYFAHYAFPALIRRGEMDFVLAQYRRCWGWALSEGLTTWPEVFDLRWSHCHQWAGSPTWQLSRYVLGLHARFDLGEDRFVLDCQPGSLASARGVVPNARTGGLIRVDWDRDGDRIRYRLQTDHPIWLHTRPPDRGGGEEVVRVEARFETVLRVSR